MNKLTVGYITTLESVDWLILSLKQLGSLPDEVVIIEDGKNPANLKVLDEFINGDSKYKVIHCKYKSSNGAQYNEILKYATGDWILILDDDEIISDNAYLLKDYMSKDKTCYDIHMIHYVNGLNTVDASTAGRPPKDESYEHYVPRRFFKNKKGIYWNNLEHTVIQGFTEPELGRIDDITIHHYGMAKQLLDYVMKYEMNLERSNMHSKEYLKWWIMSRLLNEYPIKEVSLDAHPKIIKERFYLNDNIG